MHLAYKKIFCICLVLAVSFSLSACGTLGYFSHLAKGQIELLWKREDINELIKKKELDPLLRKRLVLAQEIRAFAETRLGLPVGSAYSSYSDLDRKYAVWNVYAAPELSLNSHTWCYPIVGCLGYRGYYQESLAQKEADRLKKKGFDVRVGGVRAYSTIGYFDDPVLNTFALTNEVYFVELLIHEIAHRKIYIKDDTKFNENFATATALLGAERWYLQNENAKSYFAYQKQQEEYTLVVDYLLKFRQELLSKFEDQHLGQEEKRRAKQEIYLAMRSDYDRYKLEHKLSNRFDGWIASINNASLANLSNYRELVPGFIALFTHVGQDWQKFYAEVERISVLPKEQRHRELNELK